MSAIVLFALDIFRLRRNETQFVPFYRQAEVIFRGGSVRDDDENLISHITTIF